MRPRFRALPQEPSTPRARGYENVRCSNLKPLNTGTRGFTGCGSGLLADLRSQPVRHFRDRARGFPEVDYSVLKLPGSRPMVSAILSAVISQS